MLTLLARFLPQAAAPVKPAWRNTFHQVILSFDVTHVQALGELQYLLQTEMHGLQQGHAPKSPCPLYQLMVLKLMIPGLDPEAAEVGHQQIVINSSQCRLLTDYLAYHIRQINAQKDSLRCKAEQGDDDPLISSLLYMDYPADWLSSSLRDLMDVVHRRTTILTWSELCKL